MNESTDPATAPAAGPGPGPGPELRPDDIEPEGSDADALEQETDGDVETPAASWSAPADDEVPIEDAWEQSLPRG